jgi:hypothetical protein
MKKSNPPKIHKLSPAKQRRLDQLLQKNAEGRITTKERERLQALVVEAEELMVANSKRLADFAQIDAPQPPIAAVPVTVWVNPQLSER